MLSQVSVPRYEMLIVNGGDVGFSLDRAQGGQKECELWGIGGGGGVDRQRWGWHGKGCINW